MNVEQKIKELETKIESMKNEIESITDDIKELKEKEKELFVGYQDDEIFLLSVEEYKKYKEYIPKNACNWWWLRSPGNSSFNAQLVNSGGSVYTDGYYVDISDNCVRPALKFKTQPWIRNGNRIVIYRVP